MENCQSLIILHGWQSSKEKWNKMKEIIEREKIEVIVPDLPGFKEEKKLERTWNLNDYVDWLKDFSKNKERFFLLGHSFGGRVSIKFAVKYPENLKGLILVSAGGVESKKTVKKLILRYSTPFLKRFSFLPGYEFLRKLFYKFIVRKTDYLEAKGYLRETFKKIIEEELAPYLNKIETETLIIWGNKDEILPPSNGFLMKERIKNSKLEVLENIGHFPYSENPEILAKKILDFVKQS